MKTISENDFTDDEWGEIIGAVSQRIYNQQEARKGYAYYNADSDLITYLDRRIINLKIIEKKLKNIHGY